MESRFIFLCPFRYVACRESIRLALTSERDHITGQMNDRGLWQLDSLEPFGDVERVAIGDFPLFLGLS